MRKFTDEIIKLFELVSMTDKYRIEGSASIAKIINYGDIDLLEIAKKQNHKDILKHFKHVFQEIKKLKHVAVTDFKCGKKNGSPLRWTYDDIVKGEKKGVMFLDALSMESTIKLDIVVNIESRFLEITTVYDFGNYRDISDKDFVVELTNDYEKNVKEGNLYKALKRHFLIMKITDKKNKKLIDFINYFNEPYALLYRLKSDLSTTLLIMDESKFSLAVIKYNLDHIKESLSSFPIEIKIAIQ